jgi:hypothetical protein
VDSGFIQPLHKLVKYLELICGHNIGGQPVKQQIVVKGRKELEVKMATVFGEKIKGLSAELQRILLDDMVTAFENRLNVLNRANVKRRYCCMATRKNT